MSQIWRALYGACARAQEGGVPPHVGSFAVIAFFCAVLSYGVVAGGHVPQMVKMTTSSFGFAVENIDISGAKQISEIDILDVLALDGDTSMLGFDVVEAREGLAQIPWVERVDVRKIYPNTVQIALVEREPLALWQHQGLLDVIDQTGRVIVPYSANIALSLPLVVGVGGEREAAGLLQEMEKFSHFKERIRAYIRVADRRWDLLLENGIDIKLPEENFGMRLAQLLADETYYELLSRDVLSVDLRLDDRIIVSLSDEAMARRTRQVEEQERAFKLRKKRAGAGRV